MLRDDKVMFKKMSAAAKKGWATRKANLAPFLSKVVPKKPEEVVVYTFAVAPTGMNCGISIVGGFMETTDNHYTGQAGPKEFKDYKKLNQAVRAKVGNRTTCFYTTYENYKSHIAGLLASGWKLGATFQGNHGTYQMVLLILEGNKSHYG